MYIYISTKLHAQYAMLAWLLLTNASEVSSPEICWEMVDIRV